MNQTMEAVFRSVPFSLSKFCTEAPRGLEAFTQSLLNEQRLSTHHCTLERHTVTVWCGGIGEILVAAVISVSPPQRRDHTQSLVLSPTSHVKPMN